MLSWHHICVKYVSVLLSCIYNKINSMKVIYDIFKLNLHENTLFIWKVIFDKLQIGKYLCSVFKQIKELKLLNVLGRFLLVFLNDFKIKWLGRILKIRIPLKFFFSFFILLINSIIQLKKNKKSTIAFTFRKHWKYWDYIFE